MIKKQKQEKKRKTGRLFYACMALATSAMLWGACQSPQELRSLEGDPFAMDSLSGHVATVVFFLSPECPLCINYSLTINQLYNEFQNRDIVFYGVFPGTFYKEPEIRAYLKEYRMEVIPLLDPGYALTHTLGARVTPEAFVFDTGGQIAYRGAIDNWVPRLGQKRTVITQHYLADALGALAAGQLPPLRQTQAVGCLIE